MEVALVKVADNQAARHQPSVVPCMCALTPKRSTPDKHRSTRHGIGYTTQHLELYSEVFCIIRTAST